VAINGTGGNHTIRRGQRELHNQRILPRIFHGLHHLSAGTVSVVLNGTFSLTTSALPAGTHTIQFFVVDANWNASPLSNTIYVTI
jgi:heme-binding NEAT domain protein